MNQKEQIEQLTADNAALRAKLSPNVRTEAEIEKDRQDRHSRSEDVTVKFLQDYVAPRGEGIIGAKGAVKTYPVSKQLVELIESVGENNKPILEVVKKGEAEKRETATTE